MGSGIDWGYIWESLGKPVVIAVVVALLVLLGYKGIEGPLYPAQGVTHLSALSVSGATSLGSTLAVTGATSLGSTLAVTGNISDAGSTLRLNDNTLITGTLGVSSAFTAGTWLQITGATAITVTDGGVITPTGSYQPIVAASEVTPTLTTTGITAGSVLCLTNTGTDVINLEDSGTLKLSAAAALGQYDTLWLLFDGTNWLELSRSDN